MILGPASAATTVMLAQITESNLLTVDISIFYAFEMVSNQNETRQ